MISRHWASAGLALSGIAAIVHFATIDKPLPPVGSVNGRYYNDCCGVVSLKDGSFEAGQLGGLYVVDRDDTGPFVLPNALVTVASNRLDVDPDAYALKLRLDREEAPNQIEVWERSDAPPRLFIRIREH